MIYVTKRNNEIILLNNDLIETIEATPDTVITLTTGKKVLVMDSLNEILDKIIEYKIKISSNNIKTNEE